MLRIVLSPSLLEPDSKNHHSVNKQSFPWYSRPFQNRLLAIVFYAIDIQRYLVKIERNVSTLHMEGFIYHTCTQA